MAINAVRSTIANPNGSESSVDITNGDDGVVLTSGVDITGYPEANKTGGFYILPLTTGTIKVQLANQTEGQSFIINSTTVDAYMGTWIPMKVKRVYGTGTTATGQIGW